MQVTGTKYKAPYDQRNEADSTAITNRINEALAFLWSDKTKKATEKELAGLASCSRGTLRNRVWPLSELEAIKQARKASTEPSPNEGTETEESLGVQIDEKKVLEEALRKSRSEIALWVDNYAQLESHCSKLQRAHDVVKGLKTAAEQRVTKLEADLARANAALEKERSKNVVIPIKRNTKRDRSTISGRTQP